MPQPAANTATAEELIALYREANRRLIAQLADVLTEPARRRQAARLRDLIAVNTRTVAELGRHTTAWLSTRLPEVHARGAAAALVGSSEFAWSAPHVEAVERLAAQTWDDVAPNLRHMDAGGRRALRELTRDSAREALIEGRTAATAGRDLERWAAQRGIASVTYANGAIHTIGDYADTLARTVTANAYNGGTFTQAREDGYDWVEVFDGPDCGWTGHDDPDKANGTIRRLEDAEAHTLSHPRCARSFAPAVDVTSQAQADAGRQFTDGEQARMAAEERQRAATAPMTLSGRARAARSTTTSPGRQARTARAPRS